MKLRVTDVDPGLLTALITELDGEHGALAGWAVAWARVLPTLFIVPAFGLGILPAALRVAMALALVIGIAPVLHPSVGVNALTVPWPALLFAETLRGVPVALSAAIVIFVATVAGGVADGAGRATRFATGDSVLGPRLTPLSTLFGLLASTVFLGNGSAARLVARLAEQPSFTGSALSRSALDLAAGIGIGASIGAPVLVAALVVDVVSGVLARERAALALEHVIAPLRTLVVLVATAALLERMLEAVELFGR